MVEELNVNQRIEWKDSLQSILWNKPNLCELPKFGSKVWVHMPEGSKLDGRSVVGRWVGFNEESNGHRIYSPEKQTVSIQCSVKFNPGEIDVYLPCNVPLEREKANVNRHPFFHHSSATC
jgi:hypothetical protein